MVRPLIRGVVGLAIWVALGAALWPLARDAAVLLWSQHDPVALSDARLSLLLRKDGSALADQAEAALAADDPELARSFVDLAAAQNVSLPADLVARVQAAAEKHDSTAEIARRFASGFATGNAEDVAALSGTIAGDLLVFGDIRDLVKQGSNFASGVEPDYLVMGLAAAGLAVTAATYVSLGGVAPARAGLTVMKDARKVGRLGEGLTAWAGRSVREVIDGPALREAIGGASLSQPAQTVRSVKAAFRSEKAGGLMRVAKNVGRIGDKAGARGAADVLRIAQNPREVARAARLAEGRGSQTRAILKLFGRGALVLAAGAFQFTTWLLWAVVIVAGLLSSIKAITERLTWAWLRRSKARAARRTPGLAERLPFRPLHG